LQASLLEGSERFVGQSFDVQLCGFEDDAFFGHSPILGRFGSAVGWSGLEHGEARGAWCERCGWRGGRLRLWLCWRFVALAWGGGGVDRGVAGCLGRFDWIDRRFAFKPLGGSSEQCFLAALLGLSAFDLVDGWFVVVGLG
jgi:hypothetical protein